jgi:hypothetical protein
MKDNIFSERILLEFWIIIRAEINSILSVRNEVDFILISTRFFTELFFLAKNNDFTEFKCSQSKSYFLGAGLKFLKLRMTKNVTIYKHRNVMGKPKIEILN